MNYTLQHSKEVLTLLDGEQTHVFYHPVPGKRYDSRHEEFHIKKAAVLTYMRDVNGSSLAESSFNMTWKWVTSGGKSLSFKDYPFFRLYLWRDQSNCRKGLEESVLSRLSSGLL